MSAYLYLWGMEVIFALDKLQDAAREFKESMKEKKIFAFHGMMGSGKTTFIHALCEELDVKDVVGSPTFSIINEYESSFGKIYHIDLYRLRDIGEAVQAGVEDCLYSNEICLVEWPEKAAQLFPEDTVHVYMDVINEDIRRLRIVDN